MRPVALFLILAALAPVARGHADSESFTLSTGYNESALTPELNRGTGFQTRITRGRRLYAGSVDSRGLASIGMGLIVSSQDIDCNTSRYPMITVFGRPGSGSGFALDLHQDWYWRGTPTPAPGKHVTMFQTQGSIVCQDGEAPKVRVTHRFVTSARRFPGRTQGVEWVWEFRRDYPASYSRSADRSETAALVRRSMRAESWAFFSREVGFGILRVNVGATHKTVARTDTPDDASLTPLERTTNPSGPGSRRIPVVMLRLAYEIKRW